MISYILDNSIDLCNGTLHILETTTDINYIEKILEYVQVGHYARACSDADNGCFWTRQRSSCSP